MLKLWSMVRLHVNYIRSKHSRSRLSISVLTVHAEAAATEGRKCRRCCGKEEEGHCRAAPGAERFVRQLYALIELTPLFWRTRANHLPFLDLAELEGTLGKTMKTSFPNPDDLLNFVLMIDPDEGMYKGGSFHFNFAVNQNFPHDPPKVKCQQKIYHPNIDLEGNVCLNILREDWKPVLNLNSVIVGLQVRHASMLDYMAIFKDKEMDVNARNQDHLANIYAFQFLFLEPNASDPLNKEAAEDLRSNREGFKRNVRTSMSGGSVKGKEYERVLGR